MSAPFCTLTPLRSGLAGHFDVLHDGIVVAHVSPGIRNDWWLTADARFDLPPGFKCWADTFDTLNDLCAFIGARVPGSVTAADASLTASSHSLGSALADAFPLAEKKVA